LDDCADLQTLIDREVSVTHDVNCDATVLVANYMNRNLISRVYLWNPTASRGEITVRVFSLPTSDGTAHELTNGPLPIGNLEAKSALNIRLVKDILDKLPGNLEFDPFDGGNLTLEFTIGVTGVGGSAQVFSETLAFGTYPLQRIPSTSSVNPTVLAAHFMNGNNSVLNSRIYLWNPSDSLGDITVRVFTLPIGGKPARELTGVLPFSLGSLEGKSALNIRLAEDILDQLPEITRPYYTDDGGNLVLEFTITAASVRGVAQVFSVQKERVPRAFGTYPLRVIQ